MNLNRYITLILMPLALSVAGCSSMVFHPERELRPNPVAERFTPQDIYFPSGDGETLHGWFFAARPAKGTVLVFHGNAQNISTHSNGVLWLVQDGFNLFIIDYRGYGKSTGKPSLDGVHRDALASLEHLLSLPGVERGRVVLLGQSLGGSIAVYTAAVSPQSAALRALVLDSTFFSYQQIAREKLAGFFLTWPFQYPLSWLFNDEYAAGRWISRVPLPVSIIHDRADRVVPYHHAEQLRAAAGGRAEILATVGNGHISSFADAAVRAELVRIIETAIEKQLPVVPAQD